MIKTGVLITGSSKGLGVEIARQLLNDGYRVVNISRTETDEVKRFRNEYPTHFHSYKMDLSRLTSEDEIELKCIIKEHKISCFVNNAAIAYDDLITNLKLIDLKRMYDVNVFTPLLISKLVIRNCLLLNCSGVIVHISSISVHTGYKGLSMYASTKGALEAFSLNASREWAAKGIRSNCIVAGFMETEMTSVLDVEKVRRITNRTSQKKLTSLSSVSNTVAFLLSDKASSITGTNLFVDSGTL